MWPITGMPAFTSFSTMCAYSAPPSSFTASAPALTRRDAFLSAVSGPGS